MVELDSGEPRDSTRRGCVRLGFPLSRSTSHWIAPHLESRGGWLATGGCGTELEWRVLHPCGLARGHPRRHGAHVPPRPQPPCRPGGAPRHWTGPHLEPRGGWLAQLGAVARSSSGGCCTHVAWRAAPAPTQGPPKACRLGARSPCHKAPRHWTAPHLEPRGGWLAQLGAVALSSSGGCCTPVAWRAATRADTGPARGVSPRRPVALSQSTSTLDSATPRASRWLAYTATGGGAQLEWRVLQPRGLARGHPRRHGARPRPAASASVALAPWRSTSTLDSATPRASRWLACTARGCGHELEWRVLHPRGLARGTRADTGPVCRLGLALLRRRGLPQPRSQSMSSTSWLKWRSRSATVQRAAPPPGGVTVNRGLWSRFSTMEHV